MRLAILGTGNVAQTLVSGDDVGAKATVGRSAPRSSTSGSSQARHPASHLTRKGAAQ